MPDVLTGRQILVVGGSGGLGRATVKLLARESPHLLVSYRENLARASALDHIAKLAQADITNPEDRRKLLDACPQLYGLVVFTGDPSRVKDSSQLAEAMQRSYAVNYEGPILLAREAAERMKSSHTHGAIVLFSTMQAVAVFPGSTAYTGAKVALLQSAKILAKECRGKTDIRVNVICPGVNQAGMAEASITAGKYQRYLDEDIIPRYGLATDVAKAVRFFLEPDNYITGQVLTIDAGLTL
jgi:NAD(P)-dependent dehydrogenase (short-subunit alcohol dehydrogenase family)